MKICLAQTKPVKGNIETNIDHHRELIEIAALNNADMIIFPELSLTGYEPALARELATDKDDSRFDAFQNMSDEKNITIGIGMPLKNSTGVNISMIIFKPHAERQVYSKKYLHQDEVAYFVIGENENELINTYVKIAPAICYELSVPEHSTTAFKNNAEVYIASVAKSAADVERAVQTLSDIAGRYFMPVLMSNCIGDCDDFVAAGRTSAWNSKGLLVEQLNDCDEGLLIFETSAQQSVTINI